MYYYYNGPCTPPPPPNKKIPNQSLTIAVPKYSTAANLAVGPYSAVHEKLTSSKTADNGQVPLAILL